MFKPAGRMAGFVVGRTIGRVFEVVVLDAMGVLYVDADDVGRLLLPFLDEKGLNSAREVVEPLYIRCSSGEFSTAEFWRRLGASGDGDAWDEEYVRRYTLNAGVQDFLQRMSESNTPVAALTNDTSAWSLSLRRRFQIEHQIGPWIVSGDIGHRKPAAAIYHCLLAALPDVAPANMLFVDDRPTNLDAAEQVGMSTVRFGSVPGGNHPVVEDFGELQRFIFDR
jgi:HAD superfamily hydrolase (TIGR01509 family)